MHVLPSGFHRIRHYGLFASAVRAQNVGRIRQLLASPACSRAEKIHDIEKPVPERRCPCCGGRMIVIETFEGLAPARPTSTKGIRIDTS
jgi:hypothetical protein